MHKLEPIRKNHDFGVPLSSLREIISWKLLRPVPDFMILKTKSPYLQARPQKNKNSSRLTPQSTSTSIIVKSGMVAFLRNPSVRYVIKDSGMLFQSVSEENGIEQEEVTGSDGTGHGSNHHGRNSGHGRNFQSPHSPALSCILLLPECVQI